MNISTKKFELSYSKTWKKRKVEGLITSQKEL